MKNITFLELFHRYRTKIVNCRNISTGSKLLAMPKIAPDDLYLEKPKYPEIRDTSKEAVNRYERLDFYDTIKEMPSVFEKLLAITTNDRQRSFRFQNEVTRYGATEFVQHITKTHMAQGIPDKYMALDVIPFLTEIREAFIDTVACEYQKNEWVMPKHKNQDRPGESVIVKSLITSVVNHITSSFASQFEHLKDGQVALSPRCDAFWWRGNDHVDLFKATRLRRSMYQVPTFQLTWRPEVQIRTPGPLPPILDRDHPYCASPDVPYCPYHPKNYNIPLEPRRFLTCTPGFWPGDGCEFPFLSIASSTDILRKWRTNYGERDINDALDQAAIICSFGWLLSSATIQGFTPFQELTYPLVGQTVFTDGKQWCFYVYQMNTIALHPDVDKKTHRNICWSSGPLDLFETIEDGQVKGFNDQVLKMLLEFFLARPEAVPGLNYKPYLAVQSVNDVDEKKVSLLKKLFENRPDQNLHKKELPTWHYVYKLHPKAPISPRVKLW